MAKARLKRIDNIEPAIYKLRGGKGYELDIPAANGQRRTRPTFATEELAKRERSEITARVAGGNFRITNNSATFGDALELVRTRPRKTRLLKGSRDGFESGIRTLDEKFGSWKLKELVDAELKPLQVFFNERISESESDGRLSYIRTLIILAFKIAVKNKWLAVNPLDDEEFELVVPFKKGKKRPTFSIAEISAMTRAALQPRTKQDRLELTWSTRQVLYFMTLLAPMRDEEAAGVCWDRYDRIHHTITINRVVREREKEDGGGYEVVDDTKTGRLGEREIPVPPFLVWIIEQHRQRLIARGRPVEGRVPILVPGHRLGTGLITTSEIVRSHFPTLCRKAGVTLPRGLSFYIMRHTATNLLKSVGMSDDDVKELGGWTKSDTYDDHYKHSTPEYKQVLRPEVVAMAKNRGFDLTSKEGLIDALGNVLIARWQQEGIEIYGTQKSQRTRSPLEVALLGIDDQTPALLALPAPSAPAHPVIRSAKELRVWQNGEVKRLRSIGRTKTQIKTELGIDHGDVTKILREIEVPEMKIGFMPRAEYQTKVKELATLQAKHPRWGVLELAKALNVRPSWVTRHAQKAGNPLPHVLPDFKLGQHLLKIRKWADEGKTFRRMAALLDELGVVVTFSAISLFCKKHGIKTKRWGSGERADQYDDTITRLHGEGLDGKQIAHQLSISHSSVCRRINALGLNTPADRKANAARARAKNLIQHNSL